MITNALMQSGAHKVLMEGWLSSFVAGMEGSATVMEPQELTVENVEADFDPPVSKNAIYSHGYSGAVALGGGVDTTFYYAPYNARGGMVVVD